MWGIQKDTVYELRVMGYSRGGDGKMSHASFFTLGIVRPANRDWACQTERCHTLSNKASLQ